MKENETEYLNKLFASSSDATDEVEVEFPLVEVPADLGDKLHAIATPKPAETSNVIQGFFQRWPAMTSVAASLVVAVMAFQVYQQQQTLQQLEQAQADLATAMHYLAEANRITRAQVQHSVNENLKKAAVEPALEIGRDAVLPKRKSRQDDNEKSTRSL